MIVSVSAPQERGIRSFGAGAVTNVQWSVLLVSLDLEQRSAVSHRCCRQLLTGSRLRFLRPRAACSLHPHLLVALSIGVHHVLLRDILNVIYIFCCFIVLIRFHFFNLC